MTHRILIPVLCQSEGPLTHRILTPVLRQPEGSLTHPQKGTQSRTDSLPQDCFSAACHVFPPLRGKSVKLYLSSLPQAAYE